MIACDVAVKLLLPELHITARPFEVLAIVSMPETPVDEDYCLSGGKYEIGLARKPTPAKPIPETAGMQGLAQKKLRCCVFAFYAGHHPAARSRIDNVRHTFV